MEWNNIRNYIKNSTWIIPSILTVVTAATIGFATNDWGGMISFYCTARNPFLGFHLQRYANCPVYTTIGFIVAITIVVFSIVALLWVLFDVLAWVFKINKGNPEGKIRLPKFHSKRSSRSEFIIEDSNADNVAKFLLEYLQNLHSVQGKNDVTLRLDEVQYYDPQKYNTISYVFVVSGNKRVETRYSTDETNFTNFRLISMPEMFFITVIQGGRDTAKIKFDSHDSEILSLIDDTILNELKEIFKIREKKPTWWMS